MKETIPEGSQEEKGVEGNASQRREAGEWKKATRERREKPLWYPRRPPRRLVPEAASPRSPLPCPPARSHASAFPPGSLSVSPRSPHQFPLRIVRSCVVSYEPSIRSTFPYVIEHLPPSTPGTLVPARDTKMIGTRPLPLRRSLGRALACNTGPILCHRPLVSASFPSCQSAFPEHAHASPVALPIQ